MIIDSHQHFWAAGRGDYHWMDPQKVPILCHDYLPADLAPLLRRAGVDGTILVQAAQTATETDFLLELAESTEFVAGVVGWLDMEAEDFEPQLAARRKHPKFRGVRPMLQDLDDDAWILRPTVLRNLAVLAEQRFPFEFLTYPRHLPHVLTALEKTPGLHAVVDHLSKPPIAAGTMEPWRELMARVAEHENVSCKLSGMITEADHDAWTPAHLEPYIDHAFACFGADRLMFGSDWPVCLLAGGYGEVVNAVRTVLGPRLDVDETNRIFGDNAARFYALGERA
ncbi:MAG TPA: amidohydrolase family protein [Roseiarcus sp.]|nr:amidohydrolase family protein [Roseiarcus sp.]